MNTHTHTHTHTQREREREELEKDYLVMVFNTNAYLSFVIAVAD